VMLKSETSAKPPLLETSEDSEEVSVH
jgi:hypothetical protein